MTFLEKQYGKEEKFLKWWGKPSGSFFVHSMNSIQTLLFIFIFIQCLMLFISFHPFYSSLFILLFAIFLVGWYSSLLSVSLFALLGVCLSLSFLLLLPSSIRRYKIPWGHINLYQIQIHSFPEAALSPFASSSHTLYLWYHCLLL